MKVEKKIIAAIILANIGINSTFAFSMINNSYLTNRYSYADEISNNTENGLVVKNVNLRTEPNKTTSEVIRLLRIGENVDIVDKVGNYYKIKYGNDKYGYAYSTNYIVKDKIVQNGLVIKNVNLRTEPNKTTSDIIRLLRIGEKLNIIDKIGNYYKIKYGNDKYGYAYSTNYINIIDIPKQEIIQKGIVIKNVNLRTEPNKTTSEVIRLLRIGESIDVVDVIGNYYKIKYDENKYGYAYYPNYLKINNESNDNQDNNENNQNSKKIIVGMLKSNVNVRTEPNTTSSNIINILYTNTKVDIVDESGSFYKIRYNGNYAYISKHNVEIREDEKLDKIAELEIINDTDCMELASENSTKLLSLKAGTKASVVELLTDGWYKIEVDNQYVYIKQSNAKITNTVKDIIKDGNNIYYLNDDGSIFKGGYKVVNGVPYYFDTTTGYASSRLVALPEIENGKKVTNRYYVDKKGGYLKNTFKTLNNGKRYYFGDDGKAYRGIKTIDDKTYYFNPGYNYMMNGFCSLNGKVYYFNENTYEMEKSTTKVISEKVKIYIDSSGIMYKNEKLDNSNLAKVIYNGLNKMGTRYSHDPSEGLDCSGFVLTILKESGLNIFPEGYTSSHDQAIYCKNNNLLIDINSLEAGDLIFFNNDNCEDKANNDGYCERELEDGMHIHHVAIYIGDGKIIESTDSVADGYENNGVRIYDLKLTKNAGDKYYVYIASRIFK